MTLPFFLESKDCRSMQLISSQRITRAFLEDVETRIVPC